MWQPIETAPKDGSDILLGKLGWTPCSASWHAWNHGDGCWQLTYMGSYASDGVLDFEPEIWMPIPSY